MSRLLPIECGNCGWVGKRSAGKVVGCPKCGGIAAFQVRDIVKENCERFKATMDALGG